MEPKRRSSRLVNAAVNYNEENPRRAAAQEAAVAEGEGDSSDEGEPESPRAKPGTHKKAAAAHEVANDEDHHGDENDDEDAPEPSVRKRQRVAAPAACADIKDLSLFEVVWKHAGAIPYAVRQWVERYRQDRAEATAELMTLLLQVGGCDTVVKAAELEEQSVELVLTGFEEKIIKEGATDPFHKASKGFQNHYLKLWDKMVSEVYNSELLQDGYVMDKISRFVICMSVSVVRPFRYAATLTASQLVSSWIHALLSLSDAQNTANQQLEAEQKKKSSKVVQERITQISKTVEKKRRAVSDVQGLVNNLLDAVFAHRFRDVDMNIRALVISGFSSWILLHPAIFLADQYLKYVAWGLSDKDKVVRLAAVEGLLKLYHVDDNVLPLREFTKRFTSRFLELPYDVDIHVAIRGAQLLDRLVAVQQLDRAHVKNVYRLLAEESADLRLAVADLVVRLLDNSAASDAQNGPAAKKGKKAADTRSDLNKAQSQLMGLLRVMSLLAEPTSSGASGAAGPSTSAAAAVPQTEPLDTATVAGVVDALYDKLPVLQDWPVLCAALLDDRLASMRGSVGDANLARLLRASVRLRAERAGTGRKGKVRGARATAKDAAAMSSSAQNMSLVLMQQLPRLLQKFPTDGRVVSALMDTITDLQLEVYSLKQQEKELEALARLVSDLLLKHSDRTALKSAANTLIHLAEKAPAALQDSTQLVLAESVDNAASKLAAAYRAAKAVPDEELEDAVDEASQGGQGNSQLFNLHLALLRINVLQGQGCRNLGSHQDVSATLDALLQEAARGRNYGAGVIGAAATGVFVGLLWRLRGVIADCGAGSTEAADSALQVDELVSKRNAALECLTKAFVAIEDQAVRDAIFTVAVDLVLVMGSRQKWANTPLMVADLDVPDQLMRACWAHCLDVLERNPSPPDDREAEDAEDPDGASPTEGTGLGAGSLAVHAKVAVVAGIGRLLAFNSLQDSHFKWLGTQLVALMGAHGKAVTEVVKDVCRHMRKSRPALLPDIYLSAMKTSFSAAQLTSAASQDEHHAAMQDFSRLCAAIASTYAGHNISKGALLHICHGGIEFALESLPHNLPFLEWGLKHFSPKLHAEAAQELLEELQEGVQDTDRDVDEPAWASYDLYAKGLQERAVRGKLAPRGALKPPLPLHPTSHRAGRRISFAGDEHEELPRAEPEAEAEQGPAAMPQQDGPDPLVASPGSPAPQHHERDVPDVPATEPVPMDADDALRERPGTLRDQHMGEAGLGEDQEASGGSDDGDVRERHEDEVEGVMAEPRRNTDRASGRGVGSMNKRGRSREAGKAATSGAAGAQQRGKRGRRAMEDEIMSGSDQEQPEVDAQLQPEAGVALDVTPLDEEEEEQEHTETHTQEDGDGDAGQGEGDVEGATAAGRGTRKASIAIMPPRRGQASKGGPRKGRPVPAANVSMPPPPVRRSTRASTRVVSGSQLSGLEGHGGGRRLRSSGRGRGSSGVGSQDASEGVDVAGPLEGTTGGSLDSLQGVMATEEQLPFASQQTDAGDDNSQPPPFNMSDPEALPIHQPSQAGRKTEAGNRSKSTRAGQSRAPLQSQEEDKDAASADHARKRRRRR